MSEVYSPAEAATRLGLAGNTLRVYAVRFAPLLSTSATRAGQGSAHRQYSSEDLAVLARAKQLLATGCTYEEVLDRLGSSFGSTSVRVGDTRRRSEAATGADPSTLPALLEAVRAWAALAEERAAENTALRARIAHLEELLAASWHGRPPPATAPPAASPEAPGTTAGQTRPSTTPSPQPPPQRPQPQPRWWNRVFVDEPDEGGDAR